jgi:glycosyltransferase involved in cell wall biosynthesis
VRRLLSRATAGIAVSQAVAHSYAWTDADFDIVPNGVDISRFETSARGEAREIFGIPADTRVIASVGRLSPEKGYDTLLRAMESVVQCCPRCLLLLAGDGPQRTELQQQASVFGGQVRLLGAQEDVAPLLAAADVFAAPSRSEGQGIAVLEAMAAGLPVAASGVGGLVEVVADGRTGLLVPPDDPPALAEALCTLLLSPEVGAEMGREGRRVVAERYSLDAMAEAVRAVYGRVTVRAVG